MTETSGYLEQVRIDEEKNQKRSFKTIIKNTEFVLKIKINLSGIIWLKVMKKELIKLLKRLWEEKRMPKKNERIFVIILI